MKTRTKTFQPWPENAQRLEVASRIGINVSELINEILKDNIDQALERKSKQIQAELKTLERAKGFEPSTFTLAT